MCDLLKCPIPENDPTGNNIATLVIQKIYFLRIAIPIPLSP